MPELSFVYVTTSDPAEAADIGNAVVADRLAACANVLPGMSSIYWWQGAVRTATEAVLILKTRTSLVESLTARILALHSYETPCVVALPIVGGSAPFLEWVESETRAET